MNVIAFRKKPVFILKILRAIRLNSKTKCLILLQRIKVWKKWRK